MLAEAGSQSAPLIGSWMIGLLFFLQVVTLGAQLLRWNQAGKRQIINSPLEVKGVTDFLARRHFEEHRDKNDRDHEHFFAKLGGMERGIRAEVKTDIEGVHERVNEVGREVSAHSATLELQNQRLAAIDNKLDRLIERRPQ